MQITNIALIVLKTITSSTIHIQSAFFNLNIEYNYRDGIIVALNACRGLYIRKYVLIHFNNFKIIKFH